MESLLSRLNDLLIEMEDKNETNYLEYDSVSDFVDLMQEHNIDVHIDGNTLRIIVGNTIHSIPLVE